MCYSCYSFCIHGAASNMTFQLGTFLLGERGADSGRFRHGTLTFCPVAEGFGDFRDGRLPLLGRVGCRRSPR